MAANERLVCESGALVEGGEGVRFETLFRGEMAPAFVVRYAGAPRAYLNRCAHLPRELDWTPGEYFDSTKTLLICSLHGAMYYPDTGKCYLGPCLRGGLVSLDVLERDGQIFVMEPEPAKG